MDRESLKFSVFSLFIRTLFFLAPSFIPVCGYFYWGRRGEILWVVELFQFLGFESQRDGFLKILAGLLFFKAGQFQFSPHDIDERVFGRGAGGRFRYRPRLGHIAGCRNRLRHG